MNKKENGLMQAKTAEILEKKNVGRILVLGAGGLGNCLYQVACAVHFAETYGGQILLLKSSNSLMRGSAEWEGRKCGVYSTEGHLITYDHTIFNKLQFLDTLPNADEAQNFYNNYGGILPPWDGKQLLIIGGYQQNSHLFIDHLAALDRYISLEDEAVLRMLVDKYADGKVSNFENCVCIGIRRGPDFAGMTKIKNVSYNNAVHTHFRGLRPLLICDVKELVADGTEPLLAVENNAIMVIEPDIWQLHLARLCPNLIVSESTFHAWMGYFVTKSFGPKAKVLCFENTDITSRNLCLASWIQMPY